MCCLLLCFGKELLCCVLAVVLWKGAVVLCAGCCDLEGSCCAVCWLLCFGRELLCWLLCFGRELLCCVLAVFVLRKGAVVLCAGCCGALEGKQINHQHTTCPNTVILFSQSAFVGLLPKCLLSCPRELSICLCLELDECIPHSSFLFR